MLESDAIVVTGIGLCTPLGTDPASAIRAGRGAVAPQDELSQMPHHTAAVIERIDLRRWLKRRKDIKLMARPSQLALAAAGLAVEGWERDRSEMALFVGVGREPGDDGESAAALVAAQRNGKLDLAAVAGPCRDLYPPLLPLKTLPNMALAHISIHLDIRGENGTWCGGPSAGLTALRSAIWSIREGRAPAALAVAADSWVSAGAVRDLLRMSGGDPIPAPGEAGVAFLIETYQTASERGASVFATLDTPEGVPSISAPSHHSSIGDCRAADALLAVALQISGGPSDTVIGACERGQPAVGVGVTIKPDFACYPLSGMGTMDA
jgi:3-oxoacyl-(acyl-carrier-protein) synthase